MISPGGHSPASSRATTKSHRVLACVLCQQRKVKCDRRFPCANCVRASAQCVPATLVPRKRRRKLPEAEAKLLDRIRLYERLLRENGIAFQPYQSEYLPRPGDKTGKGTQDAAEKPDETGQTDTERVSGAPNEEGTRYEDFRSVVDRWFDETESDEENHTGGADNENVTQSSYRDKASNRYHANGQSLLFGFRQSNLDLSTMHPNQVQIFRLWQIYLDNVNPILKVTHTPTLQAQIIDAAGNISRIDPPLQALMFSIYCMAVLSLTEQQCQTQLGSTRTDLLTGYQLSCQQALLDAKFLSTSNLHCLTALYQFLVSVQPETDPRAIASMLGVAIRIAERIGIHNEHHNAKCSVVEAETRRRLWWSLTSFDSRICEVAGFRMKTQWMAEDWGCKLPLNVNDFDMRPEMQAPPDANKTPTEALFVVVRSELNDYIRRLLIQPKEAVSSLEAVQSALETGIEQQLEEKYFRFCNPENPLHFLTMWSTRSVLSKTRLILRYSIPTPDAGSLQDASPQRNLAFADAINALEADTKLITSPLTKCFTWFLNMYFPFPAYVHLVEDLKERPIGEHADQAWALMSDNMMARSATTQAVNYAVLRTFVKRILQVWEIREAALAASPNPQHVEIPAVVSHFRELLAQWSNHTTPNAMMEPPVEVALPVGDSASGAAQLPTPSDFDTAGLQYGTGLSASHTSFGADPFPDLFAQPDMDFSMGSANWNTMYWTRMNAAGWW